jgi:hypothetical protein
LPIAYRRLPIGSLFIGSRHYNKRQIQNSKIFAVDKWQMANCIQKSAIGNCQSAMFMSVPADERPADAAWHRGLGVERGALAEVASGAAFADEDASDAVNRLVND